MTQRSSRQQHCGKLRDRVLAARLIPAAGHRRCRRDRRAPSSKTRCSRRGTPHGRSACPRSATIPASASTRWAALPACIRRAMPAATATRSEHRQAARRPARCAERTNAARISIAASSCCARRRPGAADRRRPLGRTHPRKRRAAITASATTRCFSIRLLGAGAAELDAVVKNRVSHRGQALAKLRELLSVPLCRLRKPA